MSALASIVDVGKSRHYSVLVVGAGEIAIGVANALRDQALATIGILSELHREDAERAFDLVGRNITVHYQTSVSSLDPEARLVECTNGCHFTYEIIVWTSPRRTIEQGLPSNLPGIIPISSSHEVSHYRNAVGDAKRIAIVGSDYVALELAASLVGSGRTVTLIDAAERVLVRSAGEPLAMYLQSIHRKQGVQFRLATIVSEIVARNEQPTLCLSDGALIEVDMIFSEARKSRLIDVLPSACSTMLDHLLVDRNGRTSIEGLFAASECVTSVPSIMSVPGCFQRPLARQVAEAIGEFPHLPSKAAQGLSKQYDLQIQSAGNPAGHDRAILRGELSTGRFSIIYLRRNHVQAVEAVNAPRDFIFGRGLVLRQAKVDPLLIADETISLQSLTNGKPGLSMVPKYFDAMPATA